MSVWNTKYYEKDMFRELADYNVTNQELRINSRNIHQELIYLGVALFTPMELQC